ncbi:MAG: NERD domain-containing protein [Methanococcaceae archaeon]
MARMVPEEYYNKNKSDAEKLLFEQLQKLFDDSWLILHSYSFEVMSLKNKIIEAEIDFILFHRNYGLLILEVKGGTIENRQGKWYQNGNQIDDPYEQTRKNKHKIIALLKDFFNADPPVSIGYGLCFPNSFSKEIPINHRDITITGEHLEYLPDYIKTLMEKSPAAKYEIDSMLEKLIEKALIPQFATNMTLKDKFGCEENIISSLTEEQCEALNFISGYNKALIKGCAGSGKTIMAIKKAKELALKGNQVLFLCYNKLISERIKTETEFLKKIRVETYHQFCLSELEAAGIEITGYDEKELFQKIIPEKFLDLITEYPIKFDAVIIDEGQDFLEEYWITISDLVKENGYFYIFYDPEQNIFNTEISLPEMGIPYILNKNFRNTKKIFEYMQQFTESEMQIHKQSPEGTEVVHLKSSRPIRNVLSETLHELVIKNNIEEERIVILGTHKLKHTSLGEDNKAGMFTIQENGPAGIKIIPYYTCMKYKGMESDVVILLDYEDERWQKKNIKYTAISRAKHKLYIIETMNQIPFG